MTIKSLSIELSSGTHLSIEKIWLFPASAIKEIAALRAEAEGYFEGFTTGLGFWGSPGWVLGGAALLGVIESKLSDSQVEKGLQIVTTANAKAAVQVICFQRSLIARR